MLEQLTFDGMWYEVAEFKDIRYNTNGVLEVLVHWKGFQQADNTWEPVFQMYKDVPQVCEQFQPKEHKLFTEWRAEIARLSES